MKSILISAVTTIALFASPLSAGGLAEPVIEPQVIVEDSAGTSGSLLIPILLLLLVAVAVSGTDGRPQLSDLRLKTDITRIGTAASGLPLYRFSYHGLPGTYVGVMAQDVLSFRPDAVVMLPFGYLGVDYAKLGLELRRID